MAENNEEKQPWQPTCNRFVAFFDIAGTKDRVATRPANEIYEQLKRVVTVTTYLETTDDEVKEYLYYSVFSDSLIFISKDDSKESLKVFLNVVAFAFANSIRQCLPLKGAISHGEMTADKDNKIFFGQPLIDAFLIQDTILNCYGAICDNNFKQRVNSIEMQLDSWLFDYISFYKKGVTTNIKEYLDTTSWYLDWFRVLRSLNGYDINKVDSAALNNANNIIEQYIVKLYNGDKPKIKQCLDNTLKVFEYNKQEAMAFMRKLEKHNLDNNQCHGE